MSTCRNSKNCPPNYKCKDSFFGLKEGRCSPKSKVKKIKKFKAKVIKKSKAKKIKKSKAKKIKKSKAKKISDLKFNKETDPDTVMFSNAWWHWLKENWWKLLLKAMLLYFVFLAIYFAVVPLLNFQPWFSWWKNYG